MFYILDILRVYLHALAHIFVLYWGAEILYAYWPIQGCWCVPPPPRFFRFRRRFRQKVPASEVGAPDGKSYKIYVEFTKNHGPLMRSIMRRCHLHRTSHLAVIRKMLSTSKFSARIKSRVKSKK